MLNHPQVGLDFMNRDHAEFVSLHHVLLGLASAPAPAAEIDTLLDELLQHTRHHFAEEERLMQENRFPPYHVHKGEHDNVLTDMALQIERWKQERDVAALRQWLESGIGNWFVNHVSSMDFVTAGFIAMKQQGG